MLFGSRTRILMGVVSVLALAMAATTANAANRFAYGVAGVNNPSVSGGEANFERGPFPVFTTVMADGTPTNMTSVGRAFTLPAGAASGTGTDLNIFPGFAIVAQNSFSYSTTQPNAERFEAGAGAAASGSINFCPPQGDPDPLQGNLSCPVWDNPGLGNYTVRIGIDQRPGGVAFGGTLRLMRNLTNSFNWFAVPPFIPLGNTTMVQVLSKEPNPVNAPWTPGQPNFGFITDMNQRGDLYDARLNPNGSIMTLLAGPNANPTPTPGDDDLGWGFKMTTGIISGSDVYPPVGVTTPFFFFQTTGDDSVTAMGEIRNLVMIGGSISRSGRFGSLFNRIMIVDIRMIQAPEPAALGGLAAGLIGLIGLARVRRS